MKRTVMRTVAIVALLVLAVGGSAVAAGKITGKQIKNGSVTGVDIRDGSVTTSDVALGTLVAADLGELPVGQPGPDGDRGQPGPAGPRGPDGVPSIEYVIAERTVAGQDSHAHATAECPPGKDLLGGGVSTLDPTGVNVVQSAPAQDTTGWFAHVSIDTQSETTLFVWAVCGALR